MYCSDHSNGAFLTTFMNSFFDSSFASTTKQKEKGSSTLYVLKCNHFITNVSTDKLSSSGYKDTQVSNYGRVWLDVIG